MRALGLAGPAYFLPSLLKKSRVRAASPTIPTRILFFYTPHGMLFRNWVQAPSGASQATETAFELGPVLQPLQSFKQKLVLVEGMDMLSQIPDPISGSNGHVTGQTQALSATSRASSTAAGGISIDQFIAQQINAPNPVTALPSLEISVSAQLNAHAGTFLTSWTGANSLVPPMTDPNAVFNRLFPNGPPATQTSAAQAAAAALAKRRKSILDAVSGEFGAINQSLSAADKTKLDAHASLIRDLEARLSITPTSTATCTAPNQASLTTAFQADCPKGVGVSCIKDAMTPFTSLVTAALACDLTRVITLDVDQIDGANWGLPDIHAFLHGTDDVYWYENQLRGTTYSVPSTVTDPGNIQIATAFYASYAQFMANILQQLDAIPEADGSTLLDHTIVLWCSEIGSSGHANHRVNYVLAGGGGTSFKTGRYLSLPRTAPKITGDYTPSAGIPHNNLFVSLANAMGLANVTTFGNPSICTGKLTQL